MKSLVVSTINNDGIAQDIERIQNELCRVTKEECKLLKQLEERAGTDEIRSNFQSLELVVICPRTTTGDGIEEVLGAYYPLGLPQALSEYVPDHIQFDRHKPVIALFKDSIDQALPSRSSTESLWRQVLLHEIGHATLTVLLKDYQTTAGRRYAEGLANWFAWSTAQEGDRYVFDDILQHQTEEYRCYQEIIEAGDRLAPLLGHPDKIIGVLRGLETAVPTFEMNEVNKSLIDVAQSMLKSLGAYKSGLDSEIGKWRAYRAKKRLQELAKLGTSRK